MQTHSILSLREQAPVYHWLPVIYLVLFGGLFLVCLWAEVTRRKRMAKAQLTCSYVGINPVPTTVGGSEFIRSFAKVSRSRDNNNWYKPIWSYASRNLK